MVGLAGKGNDHHRSWTGIQMNFWPLVHPCKDLIVSHRRELTQTDMHKQDFL